MVARLGAAVREWCAEVDGGSDDGKGGGGRDGDSDGNGDDGGGGDGDGDGGLGRQERAQVTASVVETMPFALPLAFSVATAKTAGACVS
eukprot:5041179-Pleurochrysis_carterae.AAC.9